jgi:tetratricopeptide (TPR) repeat protein
MDLRPPPTPTARPPRLALVVVLQLASLAAIAVLAAASLLGPRDLEAAPDSASLRDVASKLKAAGALDEAARLYEQYIETAELTGEAHAKVAYSVGSLYLERGQYERALRWFYESEAAGAGGLQQEVGSKIVHTLERLGRVHAARAALAARTELQGSAPTRPADDPVVATIGAREIYASDLQRELDDLPPQLAQAFPDRAAFLRKYVADELMANKARKLEYDKDTEVRRRFESLYKQLIVGAYLEKEILSRVEVDATDVKNYWQAHRDKYDETEKDGTQKPRSFDEVRARVEQDYRLEKTQAAYQRAIFEELAAEGVELFPERLASAP